MSGRLNVEVAVVGGGPAGASAAITLARAGVRVALCDRARFPRDKCCGDGLTTAALRRLEALGLKPSAVASFHPVHDLTVRSPSGRTVVVPLDGGRKAGGGGVRAAIARRMDLDAALVELARSSGAHVLEGRAAAAVEEASSSASGRFPLVLRLAGGTEIETAFLIGADGAWSPLRRMIEGGAPGRAPRRGGDPGRADWHAFRSYASGVSPEAEQPWVWFLPALLPGYAWSFPLGAGEANVGICLPRWNGRRGAELAGAWQQALGGRFLGSLLGEGAVVGAAPRSWPIPAGIEPAALSALGGRVLFAGDAARAADPFTGEGIAQALQTGVAAAEAIVELGGGQSEAVGAAYADAVASHLAVEHRIARACRQAMAHHRAARGAVVLTDLTPWTRRQVGRWLYGDLPHPPALAPSRWRRQPAPYAR